MPIPLLGIAQEFEREVDRIQEWFLCGSTAAVVWHSPFPYAPLADGCLVSLWDAWSRFVRKLVLTCACGVTEGARGAVYTPGVERSEAEALQHLEAEKQTGRKSYQLAFGKSGEPKWYIVKDCFEIAATLELENGATVGAALTASQVYLTDDIVISNPGSDLGILRNYVAHKSNLNFAKVTRVLPVSAHPDLDSFLRSRTEGGSQVFCDWADALVALGRAAVA